MHPSTHTEQTDKVTFGFWVYLMSDCVLFASLFATYMVLQGATFGAATIKEIFDLPFVLAETLILLTSSFTIGLALLAAKTLQEGETRPSDPERALGKSLRLPVVLLGVTFLLGVAFLAMEVSEFRHLFAEGNGPQQSAFLSAFFTLVGTHGTHVLFGAVWILVLMVHIVRSGLTAGNLRKLTCLALFWHFLDVIWIFIFTFVYLLGSL